MKRKVGDVYSDTVKASQFIDDVYSDEIVRGLRGGRSHNMLTELKFSIDNPDGSVMEICKGNISRTVSEFQKEMEKRDRPVGDRIKAEIEKNLVRIDMINNICGIIQENGWDDSIKLTVKINSSADVDGIEVMNDSGFYSMIKRWVVSDHYNPTIRSEMIWDMLLSDFVCDMMRAHYKTDKEVILLAKEFPYGKEAYTEEDKNLTGPKVDYLIGIDDVLYFVELKTTLSSFDKDQFFAYKNYATAHPQTGFDPDSLWRRYLDIVNKKPGNGHGNYCENSGTEKYRYQTDRMKMVCGDDRDADNADFIIDKMIGKYSEIKLTYITLKEIKAPRGIDQNDIDQIVIGSSEDNLDLLEFEDEDDDKKRLRWLMVMDIIREAMDGNMPEQVY